MRNFLTRTLMRFAKPYHRGHLKHADGTPYMERYSLFETDWLSARLHYIVTPDYDRDMHDHPWPFVRWILQGGYIEQRPVDACHPVWNDDGSEARVPSRHNQFSIGFRRATDRHLISEVDPNTWTLFIYGRMVQWWGFYPRRGKVYYRDYDSIHTPKL